MGKTAEPEHPNCYRDRQDAAVRGHSSTLILPAMSSHQVESQDALQRRLGESLDLPEGPTTQAKLKPSEQWNSDSSIGDRINSQHLATPAHESNPRQSIRNGELPRQSDVNEGRNQNVFTATVVIQIKGTAPFNGTMEQARSAVAEMLA